MQVVSPGGRREKTQRKKQTSQKKPQTNKTTKKNNTQTTKNRKKARQLSLGEKKLICLSVTKL